MSGSANQHSKLSPSSASRWTSCSSSVGYIASNADRIPRDEGSVYAAEGTKAHDYAEEVLLGIRSLEEVPEDFRPHIKVYVDECHSHHVAEGGSEYIEAKVPLFYKPEDTGTCDYGYITPEKLVIIDYKHGAGVLVRAEGNKQGAIYARSFVEDLDIMYNFADEFPVSIRIVQPRYRGEDPISIWETTVGELRDFTEPIEDAAEDILQGGETQFAPSEDACKWCPAKGFCVARMNKALDAIPDDLNIMSDDAPQKVSPQVMSDEVLLKFYQNSKFIQSCISDNQEYLEKLALAGKPIAGTKIVRGRQGNTVWKDEDAALKYLSGQKLKLEERVSMKIITPTQAKKKLEEIFKASPTKGKNFDKLTTRSQGKKVLALESDKREAIPCGEDLFEDELPDEDLREAGSIGLDH